MNRVLENVISVTDAKFPVETLTAEITSDIYYGLDGMIEIGMQTNDSGDCVYLTKEDAIEFANFLLKLSEKVG